MLGFVGEGAHVGGADIEEVVRVLGGIGDAGTQLLALLDDGDHQRRAGGPQQMRREQDAARFPADYKDACRHELAGSPHWPAREG
jgi:hypothetical protein